VNRALPLTLVSAALFAGCGLDDPYNDPAAKRPTATPAATATAVPPAAPPVAVQDGERAALERFGRTWSNWTGDTLADTRTTLAGLADGELRATLLADARRAADDALLQTEGASSTGSVEAVVIRRDQPALVVIDERTVVGTGATQAGYAVYLARAEQTADGWKVVSWRPT
jgi:hypothetical protein